MAAAEILNSESGSATNNLTDLRPILQAILRTNENLAAQNRALYNLLASGQSDTSLPSWNASQEVPRGTATDTVFATGPRHSRHSVGGQPNTQDTNSQIWDGILSMSATNSEDFMQKFFYWDRPDQIESILSDRCRWTS